MIDASRSPRPAWKRYGTIVLLAALIAVAVLVVWTKELHHGSASTASAGAPAVATAKPGATPTSRPVAPTPRTTAPIPGGLPVSSRDPFGS